MKCANHLEKEASVVCNHCGKSICSDCEVQMHNTSYCRDCVSINTSGEKKKMSQSPVLAAILSAIIVGLGQLYNGQAGKWLLFIFCGLFALILAIVSLVFTVKGSAAGVICLIFFICGLIANWIFAIFDAYNTAKKIKQGEIALKPKTGCLIAFIIAIVVSAVAIPFLALLSAIAIPNLLRARLNANEAVAQANLNIIASAISAYRVANNGNYPLNEESILSDLKVPYNNRTISGYSYSEEFRADGFKIIARPSECWVTGMNIFTIDTSGVLAQEKCKNQ